MSTRALGQVTYLGIKAAIRRLIDKAGGLESAALATRASKTQLHRYGDTNAEDCFMPADIVVDLERDVGDAVVTRALADLAGFDLVRRDPLPGHVHADLPTALLTVTGDIGQMARHFAHAHAATGKPAPRQVIKDVEQLVSDAQDLLDIVRASAAR